MALFWASFYPTSGKLDSLGSHVDLDVHVELGKGGRRLFQVLDLLLGIFKLLGVPLVPGSSRASSA
eukprot:2594816-Alexandrium_andersonii.AAC.2